MRSPSGPLRGLLGPGEVSILGPSVPVTVHIMLHESLGLITKGGSGGSPPEKILKILENGAILCILVAQNGL